MSFFDRFRKNRGAQVPPKRPTAVTTDAARAAASEAALTPDHPVTTLPVGLTVPAVGESYYDEAFLRICGPRCADGYELDVTAELRPEPSNPYDPKAIAVHVRGLKVGHLSRDDARSNRSIVDETIKVHGVASCGAIIRGGWDRGRGDSGNFGVWLQFSNRSDALPPMGPGEYRLAPGGNVSVSHEEHYQPALLDGVGGSLVEASRSVIADLIVAAADPWRKSSTGSVIEVQIDNKTVGFLTSAMTIRYLNVVERGLSQGRRVTSVATVFRSFKKSGELLEIRLDAADPEYR